MRRASPIACMLVAMVPGQAQNRGVYPLGMSAVNSGVTASPGFSYSNQLLLYARSEEKDNAGNTIATGSNAVIMDMNTLTWATASEIIWNARYSAAATLPFARNDLTSDVVGRISGGSGFADSYYMPLILGWSTDRSAVRAIYGFLAPTGRFLTGGNDNVGSGYWTHALSSGQTFTLMKILTFSAFEMYEFHTTQEGTGIHPGETFDLDYSLIGLLHRAPGVKLEAGLAGYEQRQTTSRTGGHLTAAEVRDRYAVNSVGFAINATFPHHRASIGLKYFKEFANRSTFEGYSLQFSGSITFSKDRP